MSGCEEDIERPGAGFAGEFKGELLYHLVIFSVLYSHWLILLSLPTIVLLYSTVGRSQGN